MQTALNHALSHIADTTNIIEFWILQQTVVTRGKVITVCRTILLYQSGKQFVGQS